MATGIISAAADGVLALLLNGTSYSAGNGPLYAALHTGNPGATGGSNTSAQTARAAVGTMAGSAGSWHNSATIGSTEWASHPANETITDVSLWTASSSGTCVATGTITSASVTTGTAVTIAPSGLTVTWSAIAS